MSSLGETKGPRVYREYLGWNSPGGGTHIGRRCAGGVQGSHIGGVSKGASHMCELSEKKTHSNF